MDSSESSPSILETADPTQPLEPSTIPEIPALQPDAPAPNDTPSPNTLSIAEQSPSIKNEPDSDNDCESNPQPTPLEDPSTVEPSHAIPQDPSTAEPSPKPTPDTTTTAPPHRQSKPRRPQLTRDQRRSILLMRSLGYTYLHIAQHLNITVRGVQYTCEQRSASPKRRPGRTRILTDEKMEEIEAFITESLDNRQLNYAGLINAMGLDVREDTLVQSLRRRGWARQMAFLRSEIASVPGKGDGGKTVVAKPVRTWLTCKGDEELEKSYERVLEVLRPAKKRKRDG